MNKIGLVLAEAATGLDSSIVSTMKDSFSGVADSAVTVIKAGLPYGLTIVGTVLAITIGMKVFKKITGK